MSSHTGEALITEALRDLDPGGPSDLSAAERERAEAAFNRIIATPTDERVQAEPARPPRRRRRLLVPLALAGAAAIAIPVLWPGGEGAYATWTPTPTPLSGEAAAAAADTCRALTPQVPGKRSNDTSPVSLLRVAVAERRGGWTYVLLTGPRTEAVCLMPDDLIGHDSADGFGSFDSDAPAPPALASDRIVETTFQDGATDEGWFSMVEGFVGSDVTAVTVHTSSGLDIQVSVGGNRFAAWWPSPKPSSDHPSETWSYTVHLADGTTRRTVCSQSTQPC